MTYQPKDKLIGIRAIGEYLAQLAGGSEALDLETVVQLVATACHQELGLPVEVKATYKLRNDVEVVCSVQI